MRRNDSVQHKRGSKEEGDRTCEIQRDGEKSAPLSSVKLIFFQQAVSTERQSKSSTKKLAFSFKETGQINPGPGAGLWSALHCVRVPAPLLPGARLGGPDAL